MKATRPRKLPLLPLLRCYAADGPHPFNDLMQVPELGTRFAAIVAVRESLLSHTFLDGAAEEEFRTALVRFADAVAPPAHAIAARRGGMIRHALAHLLRCGDPLPRRLERCLDPAGPYYVEGLGLDFWSALAQGLDFARNPGWTPAIASGLRRLGLARWRRQARPLAVWTALAEIHADLQKLQPELTALHFDHFLSLVGTMRGRDLWTAAPPAALPSAVRERRVTRTVFHGFCTDTFRFLEELARNNLLTWMEGERERYRYAVREPLVELCKALAERYVLPVLGGEHGWKLETAARNGRALHSVYQHDFGRSRQYRVAQWITFFASKQGDQRTAAQWFVQLTAAGVTYGLRLPPEARDARDHFRQQVARHGATLLAALHTREALNACRFGEADGPPDSVAALQTWASGEQLLAARHVPAGSPVLFGDELVGDILLTFDSLVPLYACAAEADAGPLLARRTGRVADQPYSTADFVAETHLDPAWICQATGLLEMKGQLILQGVPGTGKTHVACRLARLLTGDAEGAVRLVQFHPAYTYEEFVEGIRVKSIETAGRHEVTYPVEDGVLCAFAAEAARQPDQRFVLLIDEINRGNLPRILGELLYLLEYRGQSITLPYSKRTWQLPPNLFLLGTLNGADRHVTALDQALRRRFSFLEMRPDAAVLRSWLRSSASGNRPLGDRVLKLFERLNEKLAADLGPSFQVGHSYFMTPHLDEARLQAIWEHQIEPLLGEYFSLQPARLAEYRLDRLLRPRRTAGQGTGG